MNIALFYGSLTGNTMLISEHLATYLQSRGHAVHLLDQSLVVPVELATYDLVIFGASTWGEGDANPTTDSFILSLSADVTNLSGVKYLVFGLGDRSYDNFCGVVDRLEQMLESKHATRKSESLRLEGFPDEAMQAAIESWINRSI